jgi:hypothetical protein
MRDRRSLPAVLEPEDAGLGGHRVEDQASAVAPAADHALLPLLREAAVPQPGFEVVESAARGDFDDDVDVLGGADGRRPGIVIQNRA